MTAMTSHDEAKWIIDGGCSDDEVYISAEAFDDDQVGHEVADICLTATEYGISITLRRRGEDGALRGDSNRRTIEADWEWLGYDYR